jgi:hypothetical protein
VPLASLDLHPVLENLPGLRPPVLPRLQARRVQALNANA